MWFIENGGWGMGASIWAVPGQGRCRYLDRMSFSKLFQELWLPAIDGQASRCHGPSVGVYTSSLQPSQCQRLQSFVALVAWEAYVRAFLPPLDVIRSK